MKSVSCGKSSRCPAAPECLAANDKRGSYHEPTIIAMAEHEPIPCHDRTAVICHPRSAERWLRVSWQLKLLLCSLPLVSSMPRAMAVHRFLDEASIFRSILTNTYRSPAYESCPTHEGADGCKSATEGEIITHGADVYTCCRGLPSPHTCLSM